MLFISNFSNFSKKLGLVSLVTLSPLLSPHQAYAMWDDNDDYKTNMMRAAVNGDNYSKIEFLGYLQGTNDPEYMKWVRTFAEGGQYGAQVKLGDDLAHRGDTFGAMQWYRKANVQWNEGPAKNRLEDLLSVHIEEEGGAS